MSMSGNQKAEITVTYELEVDEDADEELIGSLLENEPITGVLELIDHRHYGSWREHRKDYEITVTDLDNDQ